ncbi:MAG: SEC-C metal-binding domain-containing protein [Chloroflexota bacterium]
MGVRESLGDEVIGVGGAAASGGLRPGYTPTGERIGRNDACFCSSGLKYKKCHGR